MDSQTSWLRQKGVAQRAQGTEEQRIGGEVGGQGPTGRPVVRSRARASLWAKHRGLGAAQWGRVTEEV